MTRHVCNQLNRRSPSSLPGGGLRRLISMNSLISILKETDQDFEFYPTTQEIIDRMLADFASLREERFTDYGRIDSVLDIGAGAGKVLCALRDKAELRELYAIEKSTILCEQMDSDIFIIGTEFHEQSLVSKQVDLTFCNPPYSEFEEWAVKIIRESASRLLYLVIPERWGQSVPIADALRYRDAEATIVGRFDFLSSEDRVARAKVHLIRVELSCDKDDAFDRFFEKEFADLKAKFEADKAGDLPRQKSTRTSKFEALVVGANYPERLVALYNEELDHVRKNYDLVQKLDADLLREFEVFPDRILGCLKSRLAGLRNVYWQELFSHMKSVTNRLTAKKRSAMLGRLNRSGNVDFTLTNIHAVLIWVLKNANCYLNEQILDVFDLMVSKANVRNYTSNQRPFVHDRWRYNQEKPTHIALEYRLVLENVGGVRRGYSWEKGLVESAVTFLGDLMTIAHGLGFMGDTGDFRLTRSGSERWTSGKLETFRAMVDGSSEVLFEVRPFLNGNLHLRINQKLALALNVEVGRLRGWVKSGQEASDELGDPNAARYFGSSLQLGLHSLPLLAAA